jgi:hypothetical protein
MSSLFEDPPELLTSGPKSSDEEREVWTAFVGLFGAGL